MKLSANPIKIVIAARILIVRRSSESSDANRGASIFKTMAQSPHRSVENAARLRPRCRNLHCGVRPERRTTSRHITVSFAARAAASVGVLEKSRAPAAKNRFCINCSAAISFCVVASLSTIAGGVAIGMT